VKTEKQRKIEELKRNLLAPMSNPKSGGFGGGGAMVGGMGMNKIDRGDDKFKKVMDWGTPRLVTKGVEMDQK